MKPLWIGIAVVVLVGVIVRWRRLGNERRAIGLAVAIAAAVYGSGAVELPNLKNLIEDIGRTLGPWTYLLVGALAFLETGAFVGLIAPGETAILVGGVVAGQGEINVVVLIAVVWVCAVLGDIVSFWAGRRLGREFLVRHGPRVGITEPRIEQVEAFFQKHGGPTILIGRFVGLVRAIAPFVAGASKMSFARFLPYDIVGAGLWGTTFVLLGYVFWRSFDKVADYASKGAFALGTVIVVVVGIVAAYRHLRVAENRAAIEAWVDHHAQRPVVGPVIRGARRVYGAAIVPAARRVVPLVRFARDRVTPGGIGLEFTTLLAVALVGGFVFGGLASLLSSQAFTDSDLDALGYAGDLRSGFGIDVARAFSLIGSTPVVLLTTATAGIFLLTRGRALEAWTIIAGTAAVYAGVAITKALENRPRPAGALVEAAGSSFPSGHAAHATVFVAVAVAIAYAFPRLVHRIAVVGGAIVLAVAIGLSRVYLRVHYLSDVVGGWSLGAAIFAACGMAALTVAVVRQNGARA